MLSESFEGRTTSYYLLVFKVSWMMGPPQQSGFVLASITLKGETQNVVFAFEILKFFLKLHSIALNPLQLLSSHFHLEIIVFFISEAFSGLLMSLKVKVLIGCLDWTALVGHEPFPPQAEHHPASHDRCYFTSPLRSVLCHPTVFV